jgi:hypothetical protein
MKQETFEESVAKKLYPLNDGFQVMDIDISEELQVSFINGYKLAQERSYSEEDMREAFRVGFNVGYNDETSPSYLTFEEWINKFKKK